MLRRSRLPVRPTQPPGGPRWFDSLLFVVLMSGPPKLRGRDPFASLAGTIDSVVALQVGIWVLGGLWVLAHIYPDVVRRGRLPAMNPAQIIGALFIVSLTLAVPQSPGLLLTAFTLGQFGVMLGFTWIFTHRYGTAACLKHLFACVAILAAAVILLAFTSPDLVADGGGFVFGQSRLRGDYIADSGSVAVIGLILCLSNVPPLRGARFWGAVSMFGILLAASRTRSALGAFVVFLAFGFVYGRGLRLRKFVVPLAVAALAMFVLEASSSTLDYLVRERASVETMSDRLPLWQFMTDVVMERSPLVGLGYYAASRVVATQYNPLLGNAHSVFFEVLVGGGVLGAAGFLLLCLSLLWYAMRLMRIAGGQPQAVAATGLLLTSLLMGVTSPTAIQPEPLGFAFWSLTAVLPALLRQAALAEGDARAPQSRRPALRVAAGRRLALTRRHAE